jgi:hypothetical protein
LIFSAAFVRPAVAEYSVIPVKVTEAESKVLSGKVASILRDAQAPNAAAIKELDKYFKFYMFSAMTSTDPVKLGELGATREQLFTRYINSAKNAQAREHLVNSTLQAMGHIVKGNYHPAVRYNAALILGQLETGGKPIAAATEALLALLENEQIDKVEVPTAVKVGALIALQRHARLGVEAALGDRMTKGALAVATREQPPEDTTAKIYGWVRRQALQLLTTQFPKSITPPVHDALVRVIGDDKADMDDRCGTVQLLTPEMFQGAQGLNLDSMALALGELAKEVFAIETKSAQEYIDKIVGDPSLATGGAGSFSRGGFGGGEYGGGGRGMYGPGGRGGDFGGGYNDFMVEDSTPHYEKRRMIDRAVAIASGADAVAAAGSDELKERLTEFATAIRGVAEAAASTEEEMTVSRDVVQLAQDVDRMVAAWAPGGAAEPAEEEDQGFDIPGAAPAEATPPEEAADAPAEAAGGN